ncbi:MULTISPECIES: DUF411 domain-containing protein [Pseudoxanthomonas]|jgi:hypothetical protein|uniref:DUF411 domain-containing protein n=1 Tax=Pseudoxanthomonas winnipegensis TaxID=2480810 RepID=A0A4Q8M058_9GAMM|nr:MULTISPECIES: DUF411 domain-containing protein [Pseudoxanthomonas]MBW8851240.1 DUF411 domain-containing protein [Xanthomonadales bacterium]MCA0392944.1 DUF411 domain-containing protein [Pseudomonadota bacterium]KAF1709846.1 copper amine oxidase [Pseudoxanthomonas kalamensis DSM 18571]KAF1711652.1 copper amine oxidase [Pseudoxanthomonas sacheonensis]RZZ87151.1 DUF411 domain-containing protein [Pseudoxanthomonas winnipegensis]
MLIRHAFPILVLLGGTALAACAKPVATVAEGTRISPEVQATATPTLPVVLVHKSPTCGCCNQWVEHMRQAGFTVQVDNQNDVTPIKQRLGVPYGKGSCHTAEVAGYFIEGHVPAEDIKRLLVRKPDVKGLVLPGMPAGSPGMELPDGRTEPYTVEQVARDGSTQAFAQH